MWLSVVKLGKPEWLNPCECRVGVLLCTDFGRGEVCVSGMSVLIKGGVVCVGKGRGYRVRESVGERCVKVGALS